MKKRLIYSIITILLLGNQAFSQRQTTSPFSRYGYGDVYSFATAYNTAMGGVTIGTINPLQINLANPAHHSNIKKETFLFEVEVGCNFREMTENGLTASASNVGLETFSLAFPVIPDRLGCAVGLLPFNSVGYSMQLTDSLSEYEYTGDGGINQVVFGTALRIYKGLSVGANIAYLFGTTSYTGKNQFSDENAYSSEKTLTYKTNGFLCNLGLLYNWQINEEKNLSFGISYKYPQKLSYDKTTYFGSFYQSDETRTDKDTVISTTTESKTDIPQEISFGLSFNSTNKYSLGLDLGMQEWENISCYGVVDKNLNNTKYVRFGGEFIPNYRSTNYIKRMPIRLGLHFSELPIVYQSENEYYQAREMGISLGTQIKSKQTQNSLSIAVDFGKRGNSNLAKSLQETYLHLKLNITLQENWFTKRKIN